MNLLAKPRRFNGPQHSTGLVLCLLGFLVLGSAPGWASELLPTATPEADAEAATADEGIDAEPPAADSTAAAPSLPAEDEASAAAAINVEALVQSSSHEDAASLPAPATTVTDWVAQIEASQVQITGVRVEPTETGLSIVLETAEGDVPTPATQTVGNALTADIPNAVLALPGDEMFEQFGPAEGIALVIVTELLDGGVRVSITGTDAPPQAEVSTEAGNLVLSVMPVVATAADGDDDAIQVVVTATRTEEEIQDVPRSVTVITREEIEELSQLNTNLLDILGQTVPGFGPPTFRNTERGRIRGRETQILIDGVPITGNTISNVNGFRSIAPSAIERIEVVRGPSAVFGQGARGGVINIITRRPSEDEATATVEARVSSRGDFAEDSFGNYFGVNVSGNEAPVDYVFNFSTEGFGFPFDGEGDRIISGEPIEDGRNINVLGKLGVNIGENQRLQFSVNHNDDSSDEREFASDPSVDDDPDADKARAIPFDFECIDIDCATYSRTYTTLSLNYNHDDIFGSQLRLQGFYRDTDISLGPPLFDEFTGDFPGSSLGSFLFLIGETEVFGGRLEIETPISETFNLFWGADYNNDKAVQPRLVLEEESDGVFRDTGDVVDVLPSYTVESLGLFAQGQWDITPRWLLSGGVRYENIGLSADDYSIRVFVPEPIDVEGGSVDVDDVVFNIGTVYDLTDELSVFASFSQGFGIPEGGDILFAGIFSGLRSLEDDVEISAPQVVNNYELGVRGQWQDVQFSLAGFFNQSDLGTSFTFNDDGFGAVVRTPERFYGVEATVDWQSSDTWQLGGLISWFEGESDLDEDGDFEPFSSRIVSPLKITAYVENETLPGWRNRLQALYSGSRDRAFDAEVDPVAIDSYFVLDYISSIDLGPGSLQIGIQNLLDTQYFPPISQFLGGRSISSRTPAPGRTVSIGYRVTF